jgi:hypothetical protein
MPSLPNPPMKSMSGTAMHRHTSQLGVPVPRASCHTVQQFTRQRCLRHSIRIHGWHFHIHNFHRKRREREPVKRQKKRKARISSYRYQTHLHTISFSSSLANCKKRNIDSRKCFMPLGTKAIERKKRQRSRFVPQIRENFPMMDVRGIVAVRKDHAGWLVG